MNIHVDRDPGHIAGIFGWADALFRKHVFGRRPKTGDAVPLVKEDGDLVYLEALCLPRVWLSFPRSEHYKLKAPSGGGNSQSRREKGANDPCVLTGFAYSRSRAVDPLGTRCCSGAFSGRSNQ